MYYAGMNITVLDKDKNRKIVNMDCMPRGVGARYLEVTEAHIPDVFIARYWRRKLPIRKQIEHKIYIDVCGEK